MATPTRDGTTTSRSSFVQVCPACRASPGRLAHDGAEVGRHAVGAGWNYYGQLGTHDDGAPRLRQVLSGVSSVAGAPCTRCAEVGRTLWATATITTANSGRHDDESLQLRAGVVRRLERRRGLLPHLALKSTAPVATGFNYTANSGRHHDEPSSFVQVLSGSRASRGLLHTLALKPDGTLWATATITTPTRDGTRRAAPASCRSCQASRASRGEGHTLARRRTARCGPRLQLLRPARGRHHDEPLSFGRCRCLSSRAPFGEGKPTCSTRRVEALSLSCQRC